MSVQERTNNLRQLLLCTPNVDEVRNAERFISMDETEPLPNLLAFRYRDVQFFGETERGMYIFTRPGKGRNADEKKILTLPTYPQQVTHLLDTWVMPPIIFTSDGDALFGHAHTSDESKVEHYASFTHKVCGGSLQVVDTTPLLRALHCGHCGLRVTFPRSVTTLGALREHFKALQIET